MKTTATVIIKSIVLAVLGFASVVGTRAQAQDQDETEPLTIGEIKQFSQEMRAGTFPLTRKKTKISAVKTDPIVVTSGATVTLTARLVYLDTTVRPFVWRKLRNKQIEFEVPINKLAGADDTDGNGRAVFATPVTLSGKVKSVQIRWASRFQGDSKFLPSSPDGTGRFVITKP